MLLICTCSGVIVLNFSCFADLRKQDDFRNLRHCLQISEITQKANMCLKKMKKTPVKCPEYTPNPEKKTL